MRSLFVEGISLGSKLFSNKFIRNILTGHYYPHQLKRKYVLRDYSVVEARKIRKQYLSYPIPHKAKEIAFKILNDIYPSNHFLQDLIGIIICVDFERVKLKQWNIFSLNVNMLEFWVLFQSWLLTKQIILHLLNWM